MTAARIKLPHSLELLLKDELEKAIEQANLGEFDTFIAKKYLIDKVPQIDIAEALDYDRTVITRRVKHIVERTEWAANRLFGTSHTTAS